MATTRRSVVVTGASSGIGRAAALAFAEDGCELVLVARRAEPLEELAAECRALGSDVLVRAVDVRDEEAVRAVARDTVARFGSLDVWVNNAAVIAYGRLEETPGEVWRGVVETNLVGSFHGAAAAIPWFREQGRGVLVNVGSVLGRTPAPFQSAYVAAKHGQLGMTEVLRQELLDVPDVHVCAVLPGPVDTPLFREGANVTGRRVVPPGPPVDARRVASAIVRCARRPRDEVVVGGSTRVGLVGNRLSARLTERASARLMRRTHFTDEPVPSTRGNVLEPSTTGTTVDGGWREGRSRRGRRLLAGVVAAGAAAAIWRKVAA